MTLLYPCVFLWFICPLALALVKRPGDLPFQLNLDVDYHDNSLNPLLQHHFFAEGSRVDNTGHMPFRGIKLLHLPKAGGTFVQSVLEQLWNATRSYAGKYPREQSDVWRNDALLDGKYQSDQSNPTLRDEWFHIAIIRNPCDYYLSVWNFQGSFPQNRSHGDMPHKCIASNDWNRLYLAANRKEAFASWVNYTAPNSSQAKRVGLAGGRLAQLFGYQTGSSKYNGPPKDRKDQRIRDQACPHNYVENMATHIDKIDKMRDANCWLDTTRLSEDLVPCLRKYVIAQGTGGRLPMLLLDQLEKSMLISLKNRQQGPAFKNAKTHETCKEMYDGNGDLGHWVMSQEEAFAKKFGYGKCCEPLKKSIINFIRPGFRNWD